MYPKFARIQLRGRRYLVYTRKNSTTFNLDNSIPHIMIKNMNFQIKNFLLVMQKQTVDYYDTYI